MRTHDSIERGDGNDPQAMVCTWPRSQVAEHADPYVMACRLGLVTIDQMVRSLRRAVEHPAEGMRVLTVPEIREG